MNITDDQLKLFSPYIVPYIDGIKQAIDKYQINTPLRLAHFIAQIAHESTSFQRTTELLGYSDPNRVWEIFRKYYDEDKDKVLDPNEFEKIKGYIKNGPKLGNYVYANRNGNGDVASGDGFNYRGRGLIQLTGRDNYTAYSKAQYDDLRIVIDPDRVSKNPDAVLSAAWFWKTNNINRFADKDDIVAVTKTVNGGTIGLDERKHFLAKMKKILKI